ncbi:hypothetical protein D3C73_1282030 [compost metagenome]
MGTHLAQQVDAGHARHVPVGHQEVVMAAFEHRQCRGAVVGFVSIGEAQITQQVLDDPPHRRKVVNDEDFHVFVQLDLQAVSNALGPERAFNQFGTT